MSNISEDDYKVTKCVEMNALDSFLPGAILFVTHHLVIENFCVLSPISRYIHSSKAFGLAVAN